MCKPPFTPPPDRPMDSTADTSSSHHQARLMRMEVFSTSGKAWHRAYQEPYVPRNSTSTSFFAFPWEGVTTAGNKTYIVPNGDYYIKLSVLKALGDDNNPAHWETWTS